MSIGIQSQFQLLLLGCYFRLCHRLDAGVHGGFILTMFVLFNFGVEKGGELQRKMNFKLETNHAVEGD